MKENTFCISKKVIYIFFIIIIFLFFIGLADKIKKDSITLESQASFNACVVKPRWNSKTKSLEPSDYVSDVKKCCRGKTKGDICLEKLFGGIIGENYSLNCSTGKITKCSSSKCNKSDGLCISKQKQTESVKSAEGKVTPKKLEPTEIEKVETKIEPQTHKEIPYFVHSVEKTVLEDNVYHFVVYQTNNGKNRTWYLDISTNRDKFVKLNGKSVTKCGGNRIYDYKQLFEHKIPLGNADIYFEKGEGQINFKLFDYQYSFQQEHYNGIITERLVYKGSIPYEGGFIAINLDAQGYSCFSDNEQDFD